MSGAMNRHCIPGLTMSTALTRDFSEVIRNIKTMRFNALHMYIIPARADTEETGRYDLWRGKICVVF